MGRGTERLPVRREAPAYYRFQKNYYFVCGDHAANSRDSRYWGFVPEEYIVGVVSEVVESIDRTTGRERKERAGLNLLYPHPPKLMRMKRYN